MDDDLLGVSPWRRLLCALGVWLVLGLLFLLL